MRRLFVALAAPLLLVATTLVAVPASGSNGTGQGSPGPAHGPTHGPANGSVRASGYGPSLTVFGHGFGHGRGLGQWGALGYAAAGWSASQILDHYYGGTTMGAIAPASTISVRLEGEDDGDTILVNDAGKLSISSPSVSGTFAALLIRPKLNGTSVTYDIFAGPGCGGPWPSLPTKTQVSGPVQVTVAGANQDSTNVADLVGVCERSGDVRYYRGDIAAVTDANGFARTINLTTFDRYVQGVVPRESPASWGDAAGGKGIEALKAQAVAARSYAAADNAFTYAKICDNQNCQVYGGAFLRANPTAGAQALEDARSNAAVAATAGQIRFYTGTTTPAFTQFSSSTGGITAGGTFPAVPDDGDAVCLAAGMQCNPNHNWTTTVPRSLIESAYPSIGTLLVIQVTKRNGLGDLGGRVQSVMLVGTTGSVTISGWDFAQAANADGTTRVLSDWFQVVSSALTAPAGAVANGPNNIYWIATVDGGVLPFNGAAYFGSMLGTQLNGPIVSMTTASTGDGYWLLGRDGGVFSFGSAQFFGSTGGFRLNSPVLALGARPQGDGYWFVAGDGGVFAFGRAPFLGSMGSTVLNKPMVGMAATSIGKGYWMVAADGGVFSFGDAHFFGSALRLPLSQPIVAIAARPQGDGYWMVAADGGVFGFGAASFLGNGVGRITRAAVSITATASGNGYRIVAADGTVLAFGDAT